MARQPGLGAAAVPVLKRACQLYAAQILLFAIYVGVVGYLGGGRQHYADETNIAYFLPQPDATPPARQESLSAMRKMVQLFNLKLQVKCANQAEQWDWLTQAEDVCDNILSLVASKRKHWHRRMRGRKGHGQGSGRHSRSCRKLEECGCP